jgi:hypothetical protein
MSDRTRIDARSADDGAGGGGVVCHPPGCEQLHVGRLGSAGGQRDCEAVDFAGGDIGKMLQD